MIIGAHTVLFSRDADADRAFFRDVLGFSSVDAGGGWLLFALPPGEMGIHPTNEPERHELYLMCSDMAGTVKELRAKGVELIGEPEDQGFGLVTWIKLPGGSQLGLYQPRHPTAFTPRP